MLVTEPVPSDPSARAEHARSDELREIRLPQRDLVATRYADLELALGTGKAPTVRKAAATLVAELARFYGAREPAVKVLGSRPLDSREGTELFGDYDLETGLIRVWMRTAVRGRVTATGTFVATLVHELCHHLDREVLGLPGTPHTRGFFERADALYHLVRGTPAERRRALRWVRAGNRWRVDWSRREKGDSA